MKEVPFDPENNCFMKRLRCVPAFDALPDDHIRLAMNAASLRRYDPGEVIMGDGVCERQVHFLIAGEVEVSGIGEEPYRLDRLGDVFGEVSVEDGCSCSSRVTALRRSLVVAFDEDALGAMGDVGKIFTQAIIYRIFAEVLAMRLKEADRRIAKLQAELDDLRN
ncbi:cyclic nucleotide-binding domain-containing protein [Pseudodesulfovibrio cashew]|uniref:Cyclic nucleotide-binding domain-containing protein n=1 Tax=Pseudodesulfovibrio cashew TaxID=2678688 RepID=A0A6I6J9U3_9BACT|nr:cyclic nucleotide-binding domain-containing protein [Pseudodesulfovibrio cashew]QGY38811.1 cyclic nucleotide-binding domain-containing protein [Pseudodesulfovibrio cashew]